MARDTVDTEQTMRDLREMFRRWDVEFWEPIPDAPRSAGVTVRYLRGKVWQQVHCDRFTTRAQNLRQVYLLLDRLRVAEKHGVSYTGLTSSREIVAASPQAQQKGRLEEAYFVLGCVPDDPDALVRDIYRKKATYYHPDHGGYQGIFVQLDQAYKAICAARGIAP